MQLKGKVALITGGTYGIGACIALKLAAEGVHICLVARHPEGAPVVEQIQSLGVRLLVLTADLAKAEECRKVVFETISALGDINILIHSAGSAAPGSLLNGAGDIWYSAFDIHVHAAFHLCVAAVPSMKKKGEGTIVLVSSAAGLRGVKNALAYSVVKGAVQQMVRSLAFELADDNIRVNCVSPGVIRTRFQDFLTSDQVKNNVENRIPLHREGIPGDVADSMMMLITNDFITGENLVVDGGMSMRMV